MTPDLKRLGRAARLRRKELGLTQADLAGTAHCSERTIRDLEQGNRLPGADARAWIEKALGLPEGGLLALGDVASLGPAPTRIDEINSLRATLRELDAARARVQSLLDHLASS